MVVYSFYIFDRHTECIYSKHWVSRDALRPDSTGSRGALPNLAAPRSGGGGGGGGGGDEAKLIFGAVFSLRNMVRKLGGDDDSFVCYATSQYKLHFFETATNLRLVLLTDPAAQSMRAVLQQIYTHLWVEHVVKNPLAPTEHKGGEGVRSDTFEGILDKFLGGMS